MRGTIMAALVVTLLAGVAVGVFGLTRTADAHLQVTEVTLAPTPDAPAGASGKAHLISRFTRDDLEATNIVVKVKDLPVPDGYVLEGWLVDMDSGYKLSLGGFTTGHNGDATFHFNQRMVNFSLYEKVVITQEPAHDIDPNPATPVLVGDAP
jgi:hypothetical protein